MCFPRYSKKFDKNSSHPLFSSLCGDVLTKSLQIKMQQKKSCQFIILNKAKQNGWRQLRMLCISLKNTLEILNSVSISSFDNKCKRRRRRSIEIKIENQSCYLVCVENSSADFEWFLSMDKKKEEVCKHDLLVFFIDFSFLPFLFIYTFHH